MQNVKKTYVLFLVLLSVSSNCLAMKSEKDPGCCGALGRAGHELAERVQDLIATEGDDVELGDLKDSGASKGATRRCLTEWDRKKLCVVMTALVVSAGGFGAAGYLQFGGDSSSSSAPAIAAPAITPTIPLSPPPSPAIPLTPGTHSIPLHNPPKRMMRGLVDQGKPCFVFGVSEKARGRRTDTVINRWDSICPLFSDLYKKDETSCVVSEASEIPNASCSHPTLLSPLEAGGGVDIIGDNFDSDDCRVQCRSDNARLFDGTISRGFPHVCVSQEKCDKYLIYRNQNNCVVNKTKLDGWKCSFKTKKERAQQPTRQQFPQQKRNGRRG